ncbi:metallopeptidase, catalytic domain-containingprotein [Purpureocillium lavendulum]|uniref:Metallopeptidase, catalytic domain-containingprotein n=1 Tax=Purpureocillium lavendulum TaxID=1247861 RepID=A0AB34FUX9_9HYPO|nr:metallopeptidase, catalytic domain-containingprotein [Purpureocillium lavendulum]
MASHYSPQNFVSACDRHFEQPPHRHEPKHRPQPRPTVPSSSQRQSGPGWDRWLWEALSLVGSTAALVAIILLLRVYQDTSLSEWDLPVSINAILAILSALFKALLALPVSEDRESSPIICQHAQKRRDQPSIPSRYLATFGAILVLVTLAVDPFSQALVSYYSCPRPAAGTAAIPRANAYDSSGSHFGANAETLDSPMRLAIYMGLLEPPVNSSVSVKASCATGNCTFPSESGATFTTLGMCHSCSDVTSSIKGGSGLFNFSLPDGPRLSTNLLVNTTITQAQDFYSLHGGYFNITAISLSSSEPNCNKLRCMTQPFASTCEFVPCIRTYAANVTESRYEERELDQQRLRWAGPDLWNFSLAVKSTLRRGIWTACNSTNAKTETNTVQVFKANSTMISEWLRDTVDPSAVEWYPPDCVFRFNTAATRAIYQNLYDDFWNHAELYAALAGGGSQGPVWAQTLWNNGTINITSVDAYMRGLALSMSAQMRKDSQNYLNSSGDMSFTLGQAWKSEACIGIHWEFMSFQASLLVLEVFFFAVLVVLDRRSAWPGDWKSSALAPLFLGLGSASVSDSDAEPGVKARARRAPASANDMLAAAKRLKVRLGHERGSWVLQAADEAVHRSER